ncbi:MAG: amino acid adenylation domain-containing protein, partial [Chitinispirillaceae bacterium]|nr:amino acid adenylation domain-containing protein [Chitinispirillaceae bacterium]
MQTILTAKAYPTDRCLHDFIDNQANRTPDAIALSFEAKALTYGGMNRAANRLAHLLAARGVGPEVIVGVCCERSIEMVLALLAIIKAGGAYLPIDPTLPAKRIRFMVEESRCPLVLAHSRFAALLGSATPCIMIDAPDLAGDFPAITPHPGCSPDNLAYVIYTSGSTGTPKGVMNIHSAIVNRLLWMQDEFDIGPGDAVVQKTPFSFDVSVWEFFWPLMVGARLVIARPEGHKDPDYLLDLIQAEKVTVIHFVPSMLRLFLQAERLDRCASLRYVVCSGEALDVAVHDRFFACCGAQLYNLYGPTEAAVDVTCWKCAPGHAAASVPIGFPIANIQILVLDKNGSPVPPGEAGELHIAGAGLARGYVNRPDLTSEAFIPNPLSDVTGSRLYKTGDLARFRADGAIEYLGRIDHQVKIRGFRIELGEIERCLQKIASVKQAVVIAREDMPGEQRLVGYVVETAKNAFTPAEANTLLSQELPDYMVPSLYVVLDAFPLSANGKLDRKQLPRPSRKRPAVAQPYIGPRTAVEETLVAMWAELLDLEQVGIDDNFFDIGGTSLLALRLIAQINRRFTVDYQVVKVFQYPTPAGLAHLLDADTSTDLAAEYARRRSRHAEPFDGVAIIGMAGRFPGAGSIAELWRNLLDGVESIDRFSREELGPGIDEALRYDPDYIPARGIIRDADLFDASFFGISPLEAKVIDPQQRVFLELAWNALEQSGYDSSHYRGSIGVFAGIGDNHYYSRNLLGHDDLLKAVGHLSVEYGNQKDYIATRACYALDLTGPGVSVNTGCSTSLLAVDLAFRALRDHECDIALTGGSDIHVPQKCGFLYQQGGTFSRDGHCRPFDAEATGTMFNDGAGVVVLKRLTDALADNDTVYGVILATAKNNDGSGKVSFLAPSVDGQARVIAMAQALAGINPESIGYIEAHGTATPIGDPIEIEALTRAFRLHTDKKQFCWIGSIKGNIGHPTIAAGVTGLIKAALCLHHETIPATLHYKNPNPQIDFPGSPFKVIDHCETWPRTAAPRITAVSSFGFGGTNVHAILREAPAAERSGPSRPVQLLLLSAKSAWSLDTLCARMGGQVGTFEANELADAAFTLQRGRRYLPQRRFVVVSGATDASHQLKKPTPQRSAARTCTQRDPEVVFLFPGQGSQYVQMGRQLYQTEPLFARTFDRCCDILRPHLERDLRNVIHPAGSDEQSAYEALKDTFFTQPALFTIEYSLALLWMSWGIKPAMMVGHSIGEFVCACLAGVFTLEDALRLVATRGRLMKGLPRGSMLSVRAAAGVIEPRLPASVQLAAANGPSLCVVSGPDDAVAAFQAVLESEGIVCRHLHTSHAFHSSMMDPIVPLFTAEVAKTALHPPLLPFISSVTGKPITETEATSPAYWGRHLRMPVRFSDAAMLLLEKNNRIFLEAGPRTVLMTLARQHAAAGREQAFVASLADSADDSTELIALLFAVGQLWLHGYSIDWHAFYGNERRRRIPLPTYPFERKRHWVDPAPKAASTAPDPLAASGAPASEQDPDASPSPIREDALQTRLMAILSETSGIAESALSTSATFLDMGMDSLFLTQVAFQIHKEFGVKISFGEMLREYPTIAALSEHITANRETAAPAPAVAAAVTESVTHTLRIPSTLPQRGIWLSSQLGVGPSCAYNESLSVQLNGPADVRHLKKAAESLSQRHHALRARFEANGETMVIEPEMPPSVRIVEMPSQEPAAFSATCASHAHEEASTPFDLAHGPLFRVRILHSPDTTAVLFTGHHIICDGWSLDVLIYDLLDAYRIFSQGAGPLPEVPYPFAAYVEDRVGRESSGSFAVAKDYWQRLFSKGIPPLTLPVDTPRPSLRTYEAVRVDRIIPRQTIELLRAAGKSRGCSFFSTFLSGLGMFMHALSGSREVVIGLPTAEQARIHQKKLVGHCVNIIPLLMRLDHGQQFTELIGQTQQDLIEAYENQDYTLIHLLADSRIASGSSKAPPVAVGLTSVKRWEAAELPDVGMPVDYWANPKAFESFELYFNAVESATQTLLTCHYTKTIFAPARIDAWIDGFVMLLSRIAASPEHTIASLLSTVPFDLPAPRNAASEAIPPSREKDGTVRAAHVQKRENDLRQLWQQTLGVSAIDLHTSFFDAGGHSLLAARLFALIEQTLGIKAPLSLLYEAPTIALMAQALFEQEKSDAWRSLVPIQATGDRAPLFLVHGAEGNVLLYRDLVRHLGTARPVYGLQSAGLDGRAEIDPRFEIVAARYLQEIRALQPRGPYCLGGYCLGGVIALEIAQQLKARGEQVSFLAMIENYNVKVMRWPMPAPLRYFNHFLNVYYHIDNLFSGRNTDKLGFFRTKAAAEFSRLKVSLSVMLSRFSKRLGLKRALEYHHVKIDRLYDHALTLYDPQPYPGALHLFVARKRLAGFNDPLWGWGAIARGGVIIHEIPVNPRGT